MARILAGLAFSGVVVAATLAGRFLAPFHAAAVNPEAPVAGRQPVDSRLVVHEWGTFTSFAGSNGVQLDFRPLLDADLPGFVLNRQRQAGAVSLFSKSSISAPLRMETPVTYFYTAQPQTVRVRVDFPNGLLTEFYPPVRSMLPAYSAKRPETLGPSQLDWGEITLIPEASLRPNLNNGVLSAELAKLLMVGAPPLTEYQSRHYAAARQTDSALVAVNLPAPASDPKKHPRAVFTFPPPSGLHVEKFLFYRGVGKCELPLEAEFAAPKVVRVTNRGDEPLRSLFLIDVDRSSQLTIKRSFLPKLAPNAAQSLAVPAETISPVALYEEVQQALVNEGLYLKEAAAMVKTWSDSWFQEQGLRLFYIVLRRVTDELLPLTVDPPADETVRVLVGRLELLPPDQEALLASAVTRYRLARQTVSAAHGDVSALPLPPELHRLGRFAEPALTRIRELAKDDADSREAALLLHRLRSMTSDFSQAPRR